MDLQKVHQQDPPQAGLSSGPAFGGMEPLEFNSSAGRVPPGRDFPPREKSFFDFFRGYHF